jgi:hypothetical protein
VAGREDIGDAGAASDSASAVALRQERQPRIGAWSLLVTVRAISGNVTAVVERLGVTVEIHPHEVALYVRRRRSRLSGAESDVPLWDAPRYLRRFARTMT